MKKICFCKNSDYVTKKMYKKVKTKFPDVKVKMAGCVGQCKTCKSCPFSLVDGKVITCDIAKNLCKAIKKVSS